MKITDIRVTPIRLPLKTPYIWSQGVEEAFTVNLIEMEAADGTIGYGETTTAPDANAQKLVIEKLTHHFIGHSVFDYAQCEQTAFRSHFLTFGANMPRYANQMFCGLEMASLDLIGKILQRPVWDLLGGQRRSAVSYFYFLQGSTVKALADDAKTAVQSGYPVLYLKVGVNEAHDISAVTAVREIVGKHRLRLDANEAWDPATALRMMKLLEPFDVEYIEQPTPSWSLQALKQVKERTAVALGADQSVFTLHDVYQACATGAADMIAVGPREVGGLKPMIKAAAIAEGAGLNICIHSSMTTGITTCAEHHVARAIPNLDDGNQIMWQLLSDNIVSSPELTPVRGVLSLDPKPGLGFELDIDVLKNAAERHRRFAGG
ncbi:MAG: mandelate racemase/muconate lactonizing enzyme family protein [Acidiferrobacterales bacterium]|nr:mandelate racemase/muconate lactonizing enzyme family protein [Acidiferrobacterales bacterium]